MYNDYLVPKRHAPCDFTRWENTKKQIFLERAFQIEHNTAWAAQYSFPLQKSTIHESHCAARRIERVKASF